MKKKILAIGAHPDDGLFWCGATLLKAVDAGHDVHYISITNNVSDSQREALTEHCKEYGISFQTLGFPSMSLEVNLPTLRKIAGAVAEIEADIVFLMWPKDHHHDHCMAGRLGYIPLRQGHRLQAEVFSIPERIYYCDAGPSHSIDFQPSIYVDVTPVWGRYIKFLRKGACDILKHPGFETKEILARYRAMETNRGFDGTAEYAEAFSSADKYIEDIF